MLSKLTEMNIVFTIKQVHTTSEPEFCELDLTEMRLVCWNMEHYEAEDMAFHISLNPGLSSL